MRLSLRTKLFATGLSTALAFAVVLVTSTVMTDRVQRRLTDIEVRLIPRLELGPQLEADFAALRRAFQDAVAARDGEALEKTRAIRARLLSHLDRGRELLGPSEAGALGAAIVAYDDAAYAVSRRMIAREAGEEVVDAMTEMQGRQRDAQTLLDRTATPDTRELASAFLGATAAQETATRIRAVATFVSLGVVLLLSLAISRGVVRAVNALQSGLDRYGGGSFDQPIEATANDEFSDVATAANRMAERLARLAEEREQTQWVAAGLVELGNELAGELDEAAIATRTTRRLAARVGAAAAALYRLDPDQKLRLLGHHALGSGETAEPVGSFALGEGLVGQAATGSEIVVIDEVPPDFYRIRSGLGDGRPRVVVLVPLVRDGAVIGVMEFASFKTWTASPTKLVLEARENVAVALGVARGRAELRTLLARTQEQAARLALQEEQLRSANEELQAQQEELRQTNEELAQQAEELDVQRAALEERNLMLQSARTHLEQQTRELTVVSQFKSQFLANMSHELRTPLNSMLLLSKLLGDNADANLTDKQVEYANTIHSAGRDLLALINQVLDLAKIEAGKQEVRLGPVRLRDVADRARRVFAPLAKDRGLALEVVVSDAAPESITSDEQLVTQVLTNLLGNAIKFTERGRVVLRIGKPDDDASIAFSVSDTGPGIAPEHLDRIFQPFEQVDATVGRRHGGSGLGLGIAREVASVLGGKISVKSAVGKGSTFTLVLPREPAADRPLGPSRAMSATPAPAAAERAGGTTSDELLVIEDDPTFAEVVAGVVRERGLHVRIAANGRTGIELARQHQPRGVILDVKLPDIDGWEVMERLRADPATARIPIHVVSALDAPDRALSLGATGYLTKPASRHDLAGAVEALARRSGREGPRILVIEDEAVVGDSVLDQLSAEGIDARRVTSAKAALELLEKERFACIILDPALPDMSGLELLEQLQARDAVEMPAVVVYTGRALTKSETAKLEAYADAVVLKDGPSSERLLHEIRLFARRLEEGGGSRRSTVHRPSPDVKLAGRKVLVVDDDMRTVYALSAALRSRGADVLVAENGAVALAVLAEHPEVEAILMDVMMPEMDGYEATRKIREQPRFKTVPIVALTAKAMRGDEAKCLEAGATDYLPKPVDADRLLALLNRRLSREA